MRSIYFILAVATVGGCAQTQMLYTLAPERNDVQLAVSNLRYDPSTSGYTFAYDEKRPLDPCTPNRWVYVRKDFLVGTREISPMCVGEGKEFTMVQLRAEWDQPPKPIAREELEKVPSLPAKNPGR